MHTLKLLLFLVKLGSLTSTFGRVHVMFPNVTYCDGDVLHFEAGGAR